MSFHQWLRQGYNWIGSDMRQTYIKPIKLWAFVAAGLCFLMPSVPVFAQAGDAASIKLGESNLIPTVRFEYRQTNNAFLTANNTDQTEATAFVIRPQATWVADRRLLNITGIYDGVYASFSESELSYADHSVRAIVNAELSSRKRVRGRAVFDVGHQTLGKGFTLGIADSNRTQVEFLTTELSGSFIYGAANARGNVQVGMRVINRSYQNRSDVTNGLGYTSLRPFGQFSLRLSADTRAIATIRFDNVAYERSTRDYNGFSLLTGLRFAATGKSGGEFQLGASLTDFTAAERTDRTSFIAEAELFFEPNTFSRFELTGTRVLDNDADSSLDTNSALAITDTAKLNWKHEWSNRLYHIADVTYSAVNRDCPDNTIARVNGGIEMNLVLRRWLHVGASLRGESREVEECQNTEEIEADLGFESQSIGAHIRATL